MINLSINFGGSRCSKYYYLSKTISQGSYTSIGYKPERSCDGIVKTGNALIKLNDPGRLTKVIKDKGLKSEKGDLYKILFVTQEEEIQWIIDKFNP